MFLLFHFYSVMHSVISFSNDLLMDCTGILKFINLFRTKLYSYLYLLEIYTYKLIHICYKSKGAVYVFRIGGLAKHNLKSR